MRSSRTRGIALSCFVLALTAWACGSKPQPLTPDGPDMDPDAAIYQDDSDAAP